MTWVGRKLRQYSRSMLDKITFQISFECNYCWYGSKYGGFNIYPEVLSNESVVYSFGVGEDISFDLDIVSKHNAKIFAFDPTPKSIQWMKLQNIPDNISFFEYGIDSITGFVRFNLPKNKDYVSGSIYQHDSVNSEDFIQVPMKSFSDIISDLGHKKIDVLKMDIEGSEYEVLPSILSTDVEIGQIIIEIHERFFSNGRYRTIKMIRELKKHGYKCFAISESKEELSFFKVKK